MKRNRVCMLLLAVIFVFAALPAFANWVKPTITGLPATVVQPVTAAITTLATVPAATDIKETISADVVAAVAVDPSDNKVRVKTAVVENYFTHRSITPSYTQRLPLFKVNSNDVSSDVSPDVAVMYLLDSQFNGKTPADLRVVKVWGSGNNQNALYGAAYSANAIGNGKFAVISSDGTTVMGAADTLSTGNFIALCTGIEGDYNVASDDIDSDDIIVVIDPAFVYTTAALVPVTGVSISPTLKVIVPGATLTFTATVSPDTATNTNVTWSSSEPSVATIDADGIASGIANGRTTITVTTDDQGKTASATLYVGTPVTSVSVLPDSASVNVGGTVQLVETILPTTAPLKSVTWTSSNPSIATVSDTGLVTGQSAGTATITVTTTDGGKTATSTITVVSVPQPVTPGFQLPSGVENPSSIIIPGTVGESGLNSAAADTVGQTTVSSMAASGTYLVLTNSVVSNNLAYRGNSMNSLVSIKMPVFKATVSAAGATGVVMFQLPSSSLVGFKAGHVVPVKAISTSASQSRTYSFVDAASKLADGKFGIVKSDKTTFMGAEEAFVSGNTYYIVFAIKDGGLFDMNTADMYITDPTFVGLSTGRSSSGGGGCSTGAFAPAALLLALPLCAVFFNRRR